MTENQLFPMSADIFDTSSNSSNNTLKYDLYAFGLGNSHSNSNSSIALFDTAALSPNATTLQLNICTSLSANCSSTTTTPTSSASSSLSSGSGRNDNRSNDSRKQHSDANVMLTNAITIPRSNNPNQSHNFYDKDTQIHNPSTTRTLHMPLHHSMQQNNHQMMSSQQQQQHSTLGIDLDHGQQQQLQAGNVAVQQHFGHASRMIPIDLADLGLDALDASSLSPTLLQDVSLNAASPLVSISAAAAASGNLSASSAASTPTTTGFYAQDASPLTSSNNCVVSVGTDVGATLMSLSSMGNTAGTISADDLNSSLIQYEVTPNSNTMWSDIGNAIIATKNEPPFNIEDDYIFPLDKTELHSSDFPDINDDNFLEVIGTIEDLIPSPPGSQNNGGDGSSRTTLTNNQNEFILSPAHSSLPHLNSPLPSPGGPPMELLQQKLQLNQLQQRNGGGGGGSGGGGGGAIHHSHHNHHNSSSPYDLYHSTPNKQHQLSSSVSNTFSPNSQMSHSPLQINSITPPPPPHTNRSQFQQHQQQGMIVKSRNMQELLKKGIIIGGGFPMSPDCNTQQGQSNTSSHLLLSSNALSPSSASSGFGSATGGSASSTRKLYNYQQNDASISRLSSSAPTHLGLEHIWMRREPRQHLLSTGSLAEAESFSSLSTGSVLSPDNIDFSQEDDDDDGSTDYNSDQFDDFSSDGSDIEDEGGRMHSSTGHLSSSKGKERFFWQYNVQAKGPKGKRLVFQSKLEDPHVLNEVTDPVFSPNCSVRGIKHSGKARKGDGNDLTPNPRKLHSIGKELDKLSRTINDMTPVSELPFNVRPKSRKEKNKLASRACRLKKKAQHEANKIKLFGLEIEHKRLLTGIADMKQVLALKYRNQNSGELSKVEVDQKIENIYKTATSGLRIAGETTDFVNKVLENIKSGVPNGGLEELKHS